MSAARNLGLRAARTRFVGFLDDDDLLLSDFAAISLDAMHDAQETCIKRVSVISALAVVDAGGSAREVRVPPPLMPAGYHFSLEGSRPEYSYFSKQTLVTERRTLLEIGGFDEGLRSRVTTDLFWRLNQQSTIIGVPVVTYVLNAHTGPRLSRDTERRDRSFAQLRRKHTALLDRHPEGHVDLVLGESVKAVRSRRPIRAGWLLVLALRLHPARTLSWLRRTLAGRLGRQR